MRAYAEGIVDAYCQLTGFESNKLKKVSTPFLPVVYSDEDLSQAGELRKDASRILMRMLWIARLSRPDLMFITTRLASCVTTWTRFEDRQLLRCISYINCTTDFILKGEVDMAEDPVSDIITDADFGSCQHTAKSTSGLWVQLTAGSCCFPRFWQAKKRKCCSEYGRICVDLHGR